MRMRSRHHARDIGGLLTLLKMRFQEPQLLVEWAGEGGEEVRGIGIPGFLGGVDRPMGRACHLGVVDPYDRRSPSGVPDEFLYDPCIRVL
jgi:hypothetical protein